MIDTEAIVSIIASNVVSFEQTATNFAQSRFLVLASEFGQNDKERAEIEKIADAVKCTITCDGASISLSIDFEDKSSNYFEIINGGMPAPQAGGPGGGGFAHNPDGSVYRSAVLPQLWGNTLDDLAKDGINITDEIKMMLTDLLKSRVQDAVHEEKQNIANKIKEQLMGELNFAG